MSFYDDVMKERSKMQRAYVALQQPKGAKCPHCKEHIMILVGKNKNQCPACGKVVMKELK